MLHQKLSTSDFQALQAKKGTFNAFMSPHAATNAFPGSRIGKNQLIYSKEGTGVKCCRMAAEDGFSLGKKSIGPPETP